jgi:hypothetical protein
VKRGPKAAACVYATGTAFFIIMGVWLGGWFPWVMAAVMAVNAACAGWRATRSVS